MTYTASTDYDPIPIPCTCEESHGEHFAYVRKEVGGRAALEIIDRAQSDGEVAGLYLAIAYSVVEWDIPGPNGVLPITPATIDELRIEVISALRTPAMEAVKRGSQPLPNASGGRSPATSPGNRSRRRSAKKA